LIKADKVPAGSQVQKKILAQAADKLQIDFQDGLENQEIVLSDDEVIGMVRGNFATSGMLGVMAERLESKGKVEIVQVPESIFQEYINGVIVTIQDLLALLTNRAEERQELKLQVREAGERNVDEIRKFIEDVVKIYIEDGDKFDKEDLKEIVGKVVIETLKEDEELEGDEYQRIIKAYARAVTQAEMVRLIEWEEVMVDRVKQVVIEAKIQDSDAVGFNLVKQKIFNDSQNYGGLLGMETLSVLAEEIYNQMATELETVDKYIEYLRNLSLEQLRPMAVVSVKDSRKLPQMFETELRNGFEEVDESLLKIVCFEYAYYWVESELARVRQDIKDSDYQVKLDVFVEESSLREDWILKRADVYDYVGGTHSESDQLGKELKREIKTSYENRFGIEYKARLAAQAVVNDVYKQLGDLNGWTGLIEVASQSNSQVVSEALKGMGFVKARAFVKTIKNLQSRIKSMNLDDGDELRQVLLASDVLELIDDVGARELLGDLVIEWLVDEGLRLAEDEIKVGLSFGQRIWRAGVRVVGLLVSIPAVATIGVMGWIWFNNFGVVDMPPPVTFEPIVTEVAEVITESDIPVADTKIEIVEEVESLEEEVVGGVEAGVEFKEGVMESDSQVGEELEEKSEDEVIQELIVQIDQERPNIGLPKGIKDERTAFEYYFSRSPDSFVGTGTRYGSMIQAIEEILYYGEVLRQQMWRGYPLVGSQDYGYNDHLREDLEKYIEGHINTNDTLLDDQASWMYRYLADQNLNEKGQIIYEELNEQQKLIYDLTEGGGLNENGFNYTKHFFVNWQEHARMGPELALESDTYIGAISLRSPADIGRKVFLFRSDFVTGEHQFVGVAVVGGVASRYDWTELDPNNTDESILGKDRLGIRNQNGYQWAADLPNEVYYEAYGGSNGPVFGVVVVDPEYYLDYLDQRISEVADQRTNVVFGLELDSSQFVTNEEDLYDYV
ncbi:hypothetical protein KKB06_02785, partial [Patescibacteria group bacterium]|nr:hypothetical protein [Patescibacteria group bacterium]